MAPGKSHENRRENGIHLHKRQGWMAPMDVQQYKKRWIFGTTIFSPWLNNGSAGWSTVKRWGRLYSLWRFLVEVFGNRSKWQRPKHEDFRAKTELLSHTPPTFFEIDLSGLTSLFSFDRGDFHTGFATPAAIFCYLPCGGNFSHRGIRVYVQLQRLKQGCTPCAEMAAASEGSPCFLWNRLVFFNTFL